MEAVSIEPQFDTRHLIVPDRGRLSEILPSLLSISTERVSELLHLGSVYLNKKRVLVDQEIAPLSYVRVHCKPKRYPVESVNWKSRVVFENEHFVVIDKPAGFPVPAAVDNVRETVMAQIQEMLGRRLFITQRLDVPTQGLTLFATTSEFQIGFNALLANQGIYKEYLAKTEMPPTLGLHRHYMKPSWAAPRAVFEQGEAHWKECRLQVLSVTQLEENYFAKIQLLTGRTHQIRAQMKALGCSLKGDAPYGGSGQPADFFLQSRALRFTCPVTQKKLEFSI